jgi:hypothetical protein
MAFAGFSGDAIPKYNTQFGIPTSNEVKRRKAL